LTIDNVVWQREKINALNVKKKMWSRNQSIERNGFLAFVLRDAFLCEQTNERQKSCFNSMKICTHEENREKASERKNSLIFFPGFILAHRINKLLSGCDAKKEFSRFNYAKRNSFERKAEAVAFFHVDENLLNFFRSKVLLQNVLFNVT
jgi:hypothetical protein